MRLQFFLPSWQGHPAAAVFACEFPTRTGLARRISRPSGRCPAYNELDLAEAQMVEQSLPPNPTISFLRIAGSAEIEIERRIVADILAAGNSACTIGKSSCSHFSR
jgi:hypothetical protein